MSPVSDDHSRIVNRVPTLHRPLPGDATAADIIAYYQRRIPGINWLNIVNTALLETLLVFGNAFGLDWDQIWAAYEEASAELSEGHHQQ
ncbi:hypothetical protein PP484_gp40 [Gordonia phage Madeline]|uniref:Tail assembly chaperone n=1 Tax=Gordonia phage Madeline TaxID=2591189 RepID=A0A514A322_9CAUD|nr:hypothetical protein PP484_gp40 [Gordonia phage Madeline]QDH47673.1 hypothetical protein SEA_MADELINE_70 [Gordonia phage Madeline]